MKTCEAKTPEKVPSEFKSLADVARHCHVTRQAVYVAIKKGCLKAEKSGTRWVVKIEDLEEYRLNKYNRDKRVMDGELVFDISRGHFSVLHASKILSYELKRPFPSQRIYYLIHSGQLASFKKGCAWIITKDVLSELIKAELLTCNIFTQGQEA